MPFASLASRPLSAAIFLLALVAISFHIFVIDPAARPLIDFDVYMQAAGELLGGGSMYDGPYTVIDRAGRSVDLLYLYPPLLAQLLGPLTSADPSTARLVWCAGNYLAVWISILCLARILALSWWGALPPLHRISLVAFFVFCFEPLYVGLGDGQVSAIVLALLSLCALGALTGRDWLLGGAIAIAMHVKLTPILLLVAPIAFGRLRALAWFSAVASALGCLSLALPGGMAAVTDFAASAFRTADEQALSGFAHNIKLSRTLLAPLGLADVAAARWLVKGVVVAAAIFGVLRLRAQPRGAADESLSCLRAVAFLVPLMILVAPIVWFHHLAWCLVPLAVVSMRSAASFDERMKYLTWTLGIYFVCSQAYLLLIWTMKLAPALTEVSVLLPALALALLSMMIFRQEAAS
jgi:hypothetical protein